MFVTMLIILIVLLFSGMPIAHALGIESMIYMLNSDIALNALPQRFYAGIDSFTLLAIPGFLLAGNLMNAGGITKRIVMFSRRISGNMRGGLGVANVVASMVFGGISGSAIGDTASIGGILIPAMIDEGYDEEFSVGVTAASSCLAPMIPPSIPMIVVGGCASLSVGKLFVAGAIPGILLGLGQIVIALVLAYSRGYPRGIKSSFRELVRTLLDGFWALMMMVIILVGILSGFFTPTEAAIIAVVYALLVGMCIYREISFKDLPNIVGKSMVQSSALLVITGFCAAFGWILAREQIPQQIVEIITGITNSKFGILVMINLLLIFVGMFMETISALLILMPILLPLASNIGMDSVQFAVMCVFNLVIGLLTPPVGVCMATAASIGKISVGRATKGLIPFFVWAFILLVAVALVPALTTWLPNLLYG